MCVNLGPWGALLSPVHLVSTIAKGVGLDNTTAAIVSGDFITGMADKKKEDKEKAKAEQKNNEAWQKYYASRDAASNANSVLNSSSQTGVGFGQATDTTFNIQNKKQGG